MLQIISDVFLRVPSVIPVDDQVPGGPLGDVTRDVTGECELTLAPFHFDLFPSVSQSCSNAICASFCAHPLVLDVHVVLANMIEEPPSFHSM